MGSGVYGHRQQVYGLPLPQNYYSSTQQYQQLQGTLGNSDQQQYMASQKYANYDIPELQSIAERMSSEGQAAGGGAEGTHASIKSSINDLTVQNINENGGAFNDTINQREI